jgi:hypothetical protein
MFLVPMDISFLDKNYYAHKACDKLFHQRIIIKGGIQKTQAYYIAASDEEKRQMFYAMKTYPRHYGLTQKEVYKIIELESDFIITSHCHTTEAKGLGEIRKVSWDEVPIGKKFPFEDPRVFEPHYNVLAICQYYSLCKKWAKARWVGKWHFSKSQVAMMYYVQGIGKTENYFMGVLRYAK